MPPAAIAATLLLAGVLTLSAIGKLRDAAASERAFDDLRIPDALATPLIRRGLPWAEAALAVLLLAPWPLNTAAAVAVLALMAAYLAIVVAALRRPDPVDCHCFGTLGRGRVSRLTVARNGVLVALAVIAVADSVSGTPLARLGAPQVGWWLVAVVVAGWLGFALFGERPDAEGAVGDEPASEADLDYLRTPIPFGTLLDSSGPVTLRGLARERAVLLAWVSLACGSCQAVIEGVPAWRAEFGGAIDVRLVLHARAGLDGLPAELAAVGLHDPDGNAQRLFDAWGTPMAVLLGADGQLAGGPVLGAAAVADFVAQIEEQLAGASAAQQGPE